MKVLVLEDDPVFQYIVKDHLKNMGNKVTVHGWVEGAVEKIIKGRFHLLIIDICLSRNGNDPSADAFEGGLEVLEALKERDEKIPPVIFTSVREYETYRERIEKLGLSQLSFEGIEGVDAKEIKTYFQKPYYTEEFLKTIKLIQFSVNVAYARRKLAKLRDRAGRMLAHKEKR